MRTIPVALAGRLSAGTAVLASCLRLTSADGSTLLALTDAPADLTVGATTYLAWPGYQRTAARLTSTLDADNATLTGMLDDAGLTALALTSGVWDNATVEVFLVDRLFPSYGTIPLLGRQLGTIKLGRLDFSAEVRSRAAQLQVPAVALYSPTCRAALGDDRCTVVIPTATGAVTAVGTDPTLTFTDSALVTAGDVWPHGTLEWTTGANAGRKVTVAAYNDTTQVFTLVLPMPDAIQVGDQYTVGWGCDKTLIACRTKFRNTNNFRAEPLVPGADRVLDHPNCYSAPGLDNTDPTAAPPDQPTWGDDGGAGWSSLFDGDGPATGSRLWFASAGAAALAGIPNNGVWDLSTLTAWYPLKSTKGTTPLLPLDMITIPVDASAYAAQRWVSPPMNTGQLFPDGGVLTVTMDFYSDTADVSPAVEILIVNRKGTVTRKNISGGVTGFDAGPPSDSSPTTCTALVSIVGDYTTHDGDRLVVTIGGSAGDPGMDIGCYAGEDGLDLGYAGPGVGTPWLELPDTYAFQAEPSVHPLPIISVP